MQSQINRPDDPAGVMRHANKYSGGTALIVLGGYSGRNWRRIFDEINPNVLLGGNGVVFKIPDLDYWMCSENMTYTSRQAKRGNENAIRLMQMFDTTTPKYRLMSHRSWQLVKNKTNAICIRRNGWEMDEMPDDYTFREYGEGFHSGWLLKHKHAGYAVHVGTVGLHLLHFAAILGCREIHTIGWDLYFSNPEKHHWYDYPKYQVDIFRNKTMFIKDSISGYPTQWTWIECAENLKQLEPFIERDGIIWRDHSEGLLSAYGLNCTKS